ncbi:hypothetical protein Tco_1109954 [Tanacetum coccineum]|uniref:Uncharacterized protein n=1 Tax=Tanacetum coccineum TaxID=301880 RepID=A0ABQ5IIL9_9ASTR
MKILGLLYNLTTPTLTFPGIENEKLLTITSDPVVGLIYENSKQEKRVMDIKEISKFCDATLKRVLEKVKNVPSQMEFRDKGRFQPERLAQIEEVMADKGKKSSMETFAPIDKADYYSGITSITVNEKNAYDLKGKFLDDLHNNAFSGTNRKDAVEHIEYYLKIIDPIKLPNVDHDKLRVVVFPISLAGGALWDYWKMGGDEIEVSDDESSDLEE